MQTRFLGDIPGFFEATCSALEANVTYQAYLIVCNRCDLG